MNLLEVINNTNLETPFDIAVRITLPEEVMIETGEYDTLYGYCRWDGNELLSLDGDYYDLDDEVIAHEIFETESGELMLQVTIAADWIASDEADDTTGKYTGRTRADRRKNNYRKAVRKRKIAKAVYPSRPDEKWEYYDNLHQYSKNKIHCSCPMCSAKTNAKGNKGGAVSDIRCAHSDEDKKTASFRIPHWGTTNDRYGKKNYKISDRKTVQAMNAKEKEFENGEDE